MLLDLRLCLFDMLLRFALQGPHDIEPKDLVPPDMSGESKSIPPKALYFIHFQKRKLFFDLQDESG